MTVVVQNDEGTQAGANAYADEAYYRAYFALRGIDVTAQTQADVEAGLINARDYMDIRYSYIGIKTNGDDQTTQLPRTYSNPNYLGCCGYYGYGYPCQRYITEAQLQTGTTPQIDSGITTEMKDASCWYAYQWITGGKNLYNTFTSQQQTVKREKCKVDVIEEEKEYITGSVSSQTFNIYQQADNLMLSTGLILTNFGSFRA